MYKLRNEVSVRHSWLCEGYSGNFQSFTIMPAHVLLPFSTHILTTFPYVALEPSFLFHRRSISLLTIQGIVQLIASASSIIIIMCDLLTTFVNWTCLGPKNCYFGKKNDSPVLHSWDGLDCLLKPLAIIMFVDIANRDNSCKKYRNKVCTPILWWTKCKLILWCIFVATVSPISTLSY